MNATQTDPETRAEKRIERNRINQLLRRSAAEPCKTVILNALPKVVFLYPTAFVAIICGLVSAVLPRWSGHLGTVFLLVFVLNLVVLAFEFPRTTMLTWLFGMLAILFGLILADMNWFNFMPGVRRISVHVHPTASDQFYWITGGATLFVIGLAMITARRFDYWEINSGQIIHHHGVLQGVERYPAPGARISKDIPDIFEKILLGAGRLIIHPQEGGAIVLDNVRGIDDRTREIDQVLAHLDVVVTNVVPARAEPARRWFGR